MIKKTIKQFLKPGWKKVLVFIFFFLIGFKTTIGVILYASYFNFIYVLPQFFSTLVLLGYSITPFILPYLISCIIVFSYNKFRNRKNKQKNNGIGISDLSNS